MKLLKIGQVALHCSADLREGDFGTENNPPRVEHSAFYLLTCNAPERVLSKSVTAASLWILSLEEADARTGIGMSIFNSIWWFSHLL